MNAFESNGEDYDEGYDDEAYDDEAYDLGESGLLSRALNLPRAALGHLMGRVPTAPYRGSATIDTPAGRANVAMPSDLVSKKEFRALEERVLANNRAILGAGKAIGVLGMNTKKLEKNAMVTRKKFQSIQQGQMFNALLPPKLTSLTVTGEKDKNGADIVARVNAISDANPEILTVQNAKFDLMTTLLPMIVSGSMGGGSSDKGDGGSSMNMMLPLILILNDKDKGTTGKDSDNTLLLVMMMMMMNK